MFNTHNTPGANISWRVTQGSSFRGYVDTTYDKLVEVFGPGLLNPDEDKVQVEWGIRFVDGTVATIYDWKEGPGYRKDPVKYQNVTHWHIGGLRNDHPKAVHQVHEALGLIANPDKQPSI